MLNRPLTLLLGLLLILILVWSQRPPAPAAVTRTALIMGTLVEIKGIGLDEKRIEEAISAAFAAMRREEQRFSPEIENSQLALLNRSEIALEVDPVVVQLLERGQQIARDSNGAFHMGLGALKKIWNFAAENPHPPQSAEIEKVLPSNLLEQVVIDGSRVRRVEPRVQLDLGGIAKGYAVDQALEVLRAAGLKSASVNAGGDIGLLGGHAERPWKIGIQHPRRSGELLASLELRDRAIVTSGDYERYFIAAGVRYHHIFDPATGLPARGCQSVSVVADTVAQADALATAAFVLGAQKGLALLEEISGIEGLIVAADGEVTLTSGLKDRIQWH